MRETIEDWKSRVAIADREASDFRQTLAVAFFGSAAVWAGVLAGIAWLGAPLYTIVIVAAVAVILSVGFLLAEGTRRNYKQNAYIEMTLAHVEAELNRLHERVGGLEVDVGKTLGESRTYRL